MRREWLAPFRLDVRLILSVHRRGGRDPAFSRRRTRRRLAHVADPRRPGRPARRRPRRGRRHPGHRARRGARAPAWLLDTLPAQLGAQDDLSGFAARHPVIGELVLRHPGLRVGRTSRVFEALVPAVLEQKVVGLEAHRAWRILLRRFGAPAPGPARLACGFARPRPPGRASRPGTGTGPESRASGPAPSSPRPRVAGRLEQASDLHPAEAERRLRSLPGIGPWTCAEIRQRAAGDPDAVSVGDYHLPNAVGWTLAGLPVTDDAGMLELLAPYAGHRYRVTRLIELGGGLPSPPRPPHARPRLPLRCSTARAAPRPRPLTGPAAAGRRRTEARTRRRWRRRPPGVRRERRRRWWSAGAWGGRGARRSPGAG